ncbi:hypothetical protein GCM10028805_02930 [Spirosoma harenae]
MKKILKAVALPIYHIFVEKDSYSMNTSILSQIWYSTCFRLSSLGIHLTKSQKVLASLKDKYKGQRCFIIGNGPSLNNLDLTKLKNEYTFGVNAIYLNYDKMEFHPTFYVVEDYLVAEDRADEINAYSDPQLKFFGTYLSYVLKKDEKSVHMNVLRNYEDSNYEPMFSQNCVRYVGVGGSVTYICLQLAYYMGFEKIYMIGFDHSYRVPDEAKVSTNSVIESTTDDINHFAPGYFGKGYRWHDPKVDRMEGGFMKAREQFEKANRKIFNATAGGNLNVFERVDYNSLWQP